MGVLWAHMGVIGCIVVMFGLFVSLYRLGILPVGLLHHFQHRHERGLPEDGSETGKVSYPYPQISHGRNLPHLLSICM